MKLKGLVTLTAAFVMASSAAFAAEPNISARTEDLDYLYETLKTSHPDIFYNNPEESFLDRKSEIERRIETDSGFEFSMDLQSLVALVGDSHTTSSISVNKGIEVFPINMASYDGKWTINLLPAENENLLGMRVETIEGLTFDKLCEKFSVLFSADNEVYLKRQVSRNFYVDDFLAYVGAKEKGEPLNIVLSDDNGNKYELELQPILVDELMDNKISLAKLPEKRTSVPATEEDSEKYYFARPLNDSAYYIQYNRCMEDPNLSIEDFSRQVLSDLNNGSYSTVMIDLRNNGGGSDGFLQPILNISKNYADKTGAKVYGIVGERTFSSAIINAMMIKEMGGYLAGTETGGSVDHFGSISHFTLPNSGTRASYSTKLILMSDYLESGQGYGIEPIHPDLIVEQSLDDYLNGKDTVVEAILRDPEIESYKPDAEMYLTRGKLVKVLYELAEKYGKADYNDETDFYDVFPFAVNYKPVMWAAEKGIAVGNGDGTFSPAKLITRQEAAVIIDRFLKYIDVPDAETDTYFADSNVGQWAVQSVTNVVSLGIMELDNGMFNANEKITETNAAKIFEAIEKITTK